MTNQREIRSSKSEIRKKSDGRSPKGPPRHAVVFARFRAQDESGLRLSSGLPGFASFLAGWWGMSRNNCRATAPKGAARLHWLLLR